MILDLTTTYKYIGEMINDKTNLKDQIAQLERKLEAAYQTILAIAGDRHFRNTQMETNGSWSPHAWYQLSPTEEKLENLPKERRKT